MVLGVEFIQNNGLVEEARYSCRFLISSIFISVLKESNELLSKPLDTCILRAVNTAIIQCVLVNVMSTVRRTQV